MQSIHPRITSTFLDDGGCETPDVHHVLILDNIILYSPQIMFRKSKLQRLPRRDIFVLAGSTTGSGARHFVALSVRNDKNVTLVLASLHAQV